MERQELGKEYYELKEQMKNMKKEEDEFEETQKDINKKRVEIKKNIEIAEKAYKHYKKNHNAFEDMKKSFDDLMPEINRANACYTQIIMRIKEVQRQSDFRMKNIEKTLSFN